MAKLKRTSTDRGPGASVDARRARHGDPRLMLTCELQPAHAYRLVTGREASQRLVGWVRLAMGSPPTDETVWAAHGDRLESETAQYGFRPFFATRKRPSGDEFARWETAFFKTHWY